MRPCGSCTVCCTTMAVPSLGKEAGEACKHLTDKGCGIYETRPTECRTYFCLWADEKAESMQLPDWSRPDRCGVIINAGGRDLNTYPPIIAIETKPRSADGYWARKLFGRNRTKKFQFKIVRAKP